MNTNSMTPHQLVPGNIVHQAGGRFLVTTMPRESLAHRPEGYWPDPGVGPSACASVQAVCIEGEVPGYFKPGTAWSFQGNHRAMLYVEA